MENAVAEAVDAAEAVAKLYRTSKKPKRPVEEKEICPKAVAWWIIQTRYLRILSKKLLHHLNKECSKDTFLIIQPKSNLPN